MNVSYLRNALANSLFQFKNCLILIFCFIVSTPGFAQTKPKGSSSPVRRGVRPNIILCMCDDLGWGDTGFNGNKIIRTPHLDEMARHSLKFQRFYAAAPVCSPTRGSAITGRHPYRYGIHFANVGHMKKQEQTLAEILKAEGYMTGHFGKWHLGTLTTSIKDANRGGKRNQQHYSPPQENGFDVCFSTESKVPTWDPMLRPLSAKGNSWWHPVDDSANAKPYGTAYWNEKGEQITEDLRGDDSQIIMDRALPMIQTAINKQQPFFVVIWFHTPHLPVVAGPRYQAMYAKFPPYEQHYYGCITAMDEQMGRLRKSLKEWNIHRNTLLWFCSDNGPEGVTGKAPGSAGPFRGRKRSLYEGGIRVPALCEWPEVITTKRETDFPACTSDYLPTILEIVKRQSVVSRRPIDGTSLLPLLRETASSAELKRPYPIGFQSGNQIAWSDQRYKLIGFRSQKGKQRSKKNNKSKSQPNTQWELYDLISDPGESDDLSLSHPDILKTMQAELQEWIASCKLSNEGADYK